MYRIMVEKYDVTKCIDRYSTWNSYSGARPFFFFHWVSSLIVHVLAQRDVLRQRTKYTRALYILLSFHSIVFYPSHMDVYPPLPLGTLRWFTSLTYIVYEYDNKMNVSNFCFCSKISFKIFQAFKSTRFTPPTSVYTSFLLLISIYQCILDYTSLKKNQFNFYYQIFYSYFDFIKIFGEVFVI